MNMIFAHYCFEYLNFKCLAGLTDLSVRLLTNITL